MNAIDPRTLRAFVAVARDGNVSRAAERLHMSQPAVSLQLKRLAELTGLELFARSATGLALTREGAALVPQAERALAALTDFGQAAQRLSGSVRGRLRIGTILDPEFTRLGAFLHELTALAPDLEPELSQGISGDVRTRIARGDLDVGYVLDDPSRVPAPEAAELAIESLSRFTYRVIAPAGWGARVHGRDWPELARLPWIVTPPESVHHRLLAPIFEAIGARQAAAALVDQEASMLALVRSGVGLSLCRDAIAMRESQGTGLVVADRVSVDCALGFACRASQRRKPLVRCALDALARAWA